MRWDGKLLNFRERLRLACDLMAGLRWWADFGAGPQELRDMPDGRHGVLLSWCPLA